MIPPDANDEIARALRASERVDRRHDPAALRRRILAAAGPQLAARATNARRVGWFDAAAGFGRVAIPASVVAALAASAMLVLLPAPQRTDEEAERASTAVSALLGLGTAAALDADVLLPSADAILVAAAAPER